MGGRGGGHVVSCLLWNVYIHIYTRAYLDVSMEELGGVHIFQRSKYLVHDVLLVNFFEDIGSDDGMKISLHVLEDEINIAIIFSFKDI